MPPFSSEQSVYKVEKLYAGFGGEPILQSLDWELEEGESFAILGPSGSGKTLFLKLLVGLLPPLSGSIRFFGQDLAQMGLAEKKAFRESIGMTFQKDGLFDSLTCGDNLRFPLRERLKLTAKECEARVASGLESVGLTGQAGLMVHEMSGGMQKRLGIARALLFSPRVLLYDEPSAGLDPITSRSINELIAQVRERHKMTVILVTSELAQAKQLATRIGLLADGNFEQTGDWKALTHSSNEMVSQFFQA